ncbi:Protein TMED8 [Frankliniella fusca]|uniref:Protein TMED8 n=1 Tax=Frankliniella fusca TaxID=407009 RepID=A0AAE1H6P4_9NEOP|nr:Protein TMED8 [Frankliniella fusca]
MAATEPSVESQLEDFSGLAINEGTPGSDCEGNDRKEINDVHEKWGLRLKDVYRLAVQFYREKEGKAVHFSYQDKLKLVAYTQQVVRGKFNDEKLPPLGVLDVPGRDRRLAWQALGDMAQEEAMKSFVDLLDSLCHLFKPFIEAHKRDGEERERLASLIWCHVSLAMHSQEQEEREKKLEEEKKLQAEQERLKEEEALQQEAQRRKIQEALNQQTFAQFKSYAEQQFPGNPEQQGVLIRQLQEQHYHQYMQQLLHQQSGATGTNDKEEEFPVTNLAHENLTYYTNVGKTLPMATSTGTIISNGNIEEGVSEGDDENLLDFPEISPASMWTHKDLKEFKESIRKEASEAVIKVGHGETVTLRVPTHEKGSSLYWEFATDNYDIGFGVYFEWTKPTTSAVTLHVSESEDDEEEDDDDDEEIVYPEGSDIEAGTEKGQKSSALNRPLVSVIVPVYRRDCQEEVYAGIHQYPGEGVYLLKFDNSYSLWRSKTLYYRVYYHP